MIWYSAERAGFFHETLHAGRMPADAVKIGPKRHRQLLDAQAGGKQIVAGAGGKPMAIDPPAPQAEDLWRSLRGRRDALLRESDWTQLPDAPLATAQAWRAYRAALRDLPANTADPAKPNWPAVP